MDLGIVAAANETLMGMDALHRVISDNMSCKNKVYHLTNNDHIVPI